MNSLLVCTDGSDYAQVCCQYAAWLAARQQARVTVLYMTDLHQFEAPLVGDLAGSVGAQPYQNFITQLREVEKEKARVIGEAAKATFHEKGIDIAFRHETGLLVDYLSDHEDEYDIVILGKRGAHVDQAMEHLGSSMERVVRASKKPAFVTSRSFREIQRAVFAYDGGPSCRKALEFLEKSSTFHGIEIQVVGVVEDNDDESKTTTDAEEAEKRLSEAGYATTSRILYGKSEEAVADYVKSEDVQMLIMGAYGHSRIRYLIIGSTTTALLRECRVPVLCFR